MSLHSPKNRYMVEINFDIALKELGSKVTFTSDSIEALKSLASDTAKDHKCSVVIRENKADYPAFNWQVIERYRLPVLLFSERERIGRRVEELRKASGLTQEELAEKCGMSRATVNKIEAGKFSVGLDLIAKVARMLGGELDIVKKY